MLHNTSLKPMRVLPLLRLTFGLGQLPGRSADQEAKCDASPKTGKVGADLRPGIAWRRGNWIDARQSWKANANVRHRAPGSSDRRQASRLAALRFRGKADRQS
ncbi:MAG: hypothetical protein ACRESZ_10210 [Methylococcales bacterium]